MSRPLTCESYPVLEAADQCVLCGLCSAQCPTYLISREEAESPRGRVTLIQALMGGQIAQDSALEDHLDRCLGCRTCERACPSGVPYGRLMDHARQHLEAGRARGWRARALRRFGLDHLIARKGPRRLAGRLLRAAQVSGLRTLARAAGVLGLAGMAPWDRRLGHVPPQRRWQAYYPPLSAHRGDVGLFVGCVAEILDTPTLAAALALLRRCGYGVHVPPSQGCCGALHQHNGEPGAARVLAEANAAAFAHVDFVIYTASGCGASLVEYGQLGPAAAPLAEKAWEASAFLNQAPGLGALRFTPLEQRVLLHTPCTLRNVLRGEHEPRALLQRIPGLVIQALPASPACCGAAGSHVLTHPVLADQLRQRLLDGADLSNPSRLLSSNIGCAMHLAAGLGARGLDMAVEHPLVLLARQLEKEHSDVTAPVPR